MILMLIRLGTRFCLHGLGDCIIKDTGCILITNQLDGCWFPKYYVITNIKNFALELIRVAI
jgi:3D (Asp-Asp-Asp) domain-containing protein